MYVHGICHAHVHVCVRSHVHSVSIEERAQAWVWVWVRVRVVSLAGAIEACMHMWHAHVHPICACTCHMSHVHVHSPCGCHGSLRQSPAICACTCTCHMCTRLAAAIEACGSYRALCVVDAHDGLLLCMHVCMLCMWACMSACCACAHACAHVRMRVCMHVRTSSVCVQSISQRRPSIEAVSKTASVRLG